ncbi:MAG TPA: class I lanthipeptide [Kofleriaceae bacterium]|nr:class I lanthipeptide [Kofleriaceae bacterium]HMG56380.1 class I lanthipeptide [Kofleriaceae bacterium]
MKKAGNKLVLNKQTIRALATDELAAVGGGWIRPPITWSCPQPGLPKNFE